MAATAVRHREYGSVFKYVLLLPAVIWVIAFTKDWISLFYLFHN